MEISRQSRISKQSLQIAKMKIVITTLWDWIKFKPATGNILGSRAFWIQVCTQPEGDSSHTAKAGSRLKIMYFK